MKKLSDCKTIKEIVLNIPEKVCYNISFWLISIYFLLPIFILLTNIFVKGSSIMYLYIGLFVSGGIGLLNGLLYFLKKYFNGKVNKRALLPIIIIGLYFIWCLISCILAQNKEFAFLGNSYRRDGYISYLLYFGFFINGFIVSHNKNYLKRTLHVLLISSSIMALLFVMNNDLTKVLLIGSNMYRSDLNVAIFSQYNHYGYYLTVSICAAFSMFLFSKKKEMSIIYLLDYILLLYVLIKNDTFGCYLAVCFSIICMFIYIIVLKKNIIRGLIVLLCLILVSCFFSNVGNNLFKTGNEMIGIGKNLKNIEKTLDKDGRPILCYGTNRLDLWVNGIKFIGNKPIFGYGLENLEEPYAKVLRCEITDRPHNMFIQVGANTGIMGLILYILFLSITFINILKKLKFIDKNVMCFVFICIGYITSSMFGNSMFYTSPYYMISLGIIFSVYFMERTKVNDRKKN